MLLLSLSLELCTAEVQALEPNAFDKATEAD